MRQVVAFNRQTEQLLKLDKRDLVSISGPVAVNEWESSGKTQRKIQVACQDIIATRLTRLGGGKKNFLMPLRCGWTIKGSFIR
jgi:hypothetical protein